MRQFYVLILALCCVFSINATNYLVSSNGYTPGEWTEYQQKYFLAGATHFQTITEVLNKVEPGDNIYLAPGTYSGNFTLSVDNISIFGNNSWTDVRSGKRDTSNESIITGTITLKANGITINGLKFTGAGRVLNNTAANGSPIKNITLKYNLVEASTLGSSTAVFTFGTIHNNADANSDVSQLKFENINISHNDFDGTNSTNLCPFIKIGGGYGNITIHDNKFTEGGNSIEIAHSRGNISVTNNKFKDVGQSLYDASAEIEERGGAFCVYLNRNSYAGTTNIDVSHNGFNNCVGRYTLYTLIRYFQGDSDKEDAYVVPVGTTAKMNHNVFLNKSTYTVGNYNYVIYCNEGYMGDVTVDARYNYFDNSDMCMGLIKMPGKTKQERFFANSFGFYDFRKSQNVSYEQILTSWVNPRSCRVAQSFDISEYYDENGEPYYYFNHVQELGTSGNNSTYGCVEAQLLTRVKKPNANDEARAHMDIIHGGHGSNMATFRNNGADWICFGGNGKLSSSGESCLSNGITFFPFHSANLKHSTNPSKVDLGNGTTSYIDINGKTRRIYHFTTDNELSGGSWYNHFPAIDETSRYLAVLSRKSSGPMCVEIYDLDAVLNHLVNGAPRPSLISSFQIAKGADAYSGITGDQGFWTWDHQGFTISGDYIYFLEGCGAKNSSAINKEPTVIFHAYNWRTGKSHLRRTVEAGPIMSMEHGEPEGIKIRRAANGRPYLYLGIANGPEGNRNVNIFKYTNQYTDNGLPYGIELPLSKGKTAPDATSLSFSTSSSETKTITLSNTYLKGDMSVTIAGANAEFFNVVATNINALSNTSTLKVTYCPVAPTSTSHSAVIRISSTYADDVIIPLSGTFTDEIIKIVDTPVAPIDVVTHQQVVDGKYSFNLVVDATINSTNIDRTTYTGTQALDLAKYYTIVIPQSLAETTTSVTGANGEEMTIYYGAISVADEGVINILDAFYVQVEADAINKAMPTMVFHNVDPQATYSVDAYLSNATTESEMNSTGWTYLKFTKASITTEAMTMPGTNYTFGNINLDLIEENPVATAIDDMPMGSFRQVMSDVPTNPVDFVSTNYISTSGSVIQALNVTDEVLDNWDISYNIKLNHGTTTHQYPDIVASNTPISVDFAYLPFDSYNDAGKDGRNYNVAEKSTELSANVDVVYTRNDKSATITDASQSTLTYLSQDLFPKISEVGSQGTLVKKTETHNDSKIGNYWKTYYDALAQLTWTRPSDAYHLIGYYANAIQDGEELFCWGHPIKDSGSKEWIQFVFGSVLSDSEVSLAKCNFLQPIGYNLTNNWSHLAAVNERIPLYIHYVLATNDDDKGINDFATVNLWISADYPILVKEKPEITISNIATVNDSPVSMKVISSIGAVSASNTPTLQIEISSVTTGIEDIVVDHSDDVKYYNLQGVEVANPSNGVYIKIEGSKASKVFVK